MSEKYANEYKFLKENEWFFKDHWKNDPIMPGFPQIEAFVQTMCFNHTGIRLQKR